VYSAKQILEMHQAGGILTDRLIDPDRLQSMVDRADSDAVELVRLAAAVINAKSELHEAVTRLTSKYNLVQS
jgi:hypothetical protein